MLRRYFIPFLAVCGFAFAFFMMYWSAQKPPVHEVRFAPPVPPYTHYVAGEGLIESYGTDIDIGVPFPDLIADVAVQTGQFVKKDDLLFLLDIRQFKADLRQAFAELCAAQSIYKNAQQQFLFYEQLQEKSAVSQTDYTQAYYAQQTAAERVRVAVAQIGRIQTQIERSHIRAPFDGVVLQSNVHVGEFANVNPFDNKSLIVFGDTSKTQLRVTIAEEDAWRVVPGAKAVAFVRGNPAITFELTFDYIEPLLEQKQRLTGSDSERVDTRVLEIVYTFNKGDSPVYVGQLLDVYVEAKPSKIV